MDLLSISNAAVFGALSLALVWLVISPAVRDGVVIKCGMIVAALGFGSIAIRMFSSTDPIGLERSLLMVGIGLSVIIVWGIVRVRVSERLSEWVHTKQVHR